MEKIILTNNLTKDYGNKKGIFNVNLEVNKGEVFGFLGPNGAGKTTTIRNLMGFIKPDSGECSINGMNCFDNAKDIQKNLGYLAGEIAFFDDITGTQMLNFVADMKGIKDKTRMNKLIEMFELDSRGKIKKMSKGMKQKLGIISAFMADPEIIILDEPTSGLDPLMQNRFVELILEEKKKGTTILMSSHIFEEIEKTCDRTAIIREGKIVAIEKMSEMSMKKNRTYIVTFTEQNELNRARNELNIKHEDGCTATIAVESDLSDFFHRISNYKISDFDVKKESLEEIFLHYYGKGDK